MKSSDKYNHKIVDSSFDFSVITVVRNGVDTIRKTLESVIEQKGINVQYIVVDGLSDDGTLNVLEQYNDEIDVFISENDTGIYNAMNKGIELVEGKWINFMNCGDVFVSNDVLEKVLEQEDDEAVLLYGNKIREGDKVTPMPLMKLKEGIIMACHQAMFFNYKKLGKDLFYDESKKIYADYELVNRIYLKYPELLNYIDVNVVDFELGGISYNPSFQKRKDKYTTLLSHYGIFHTVKQLIKQLIEKL